MSQSWKDHRLNIPDDIAFNINSSSSSQYRLLPIGWIKRMWRPDSFFKVSVNFKLYLFKVLKRKTKFSKYEFYNKMVLFKSLECKASHFSRDDNP